KKWDENGQRIQIKSRREIEMFWKEEGTLAPCPWNLAKASGNGQFVATIEDGPRSSVFVVDHEQQHGGYASVGKADSDKTVKITLLALVRVTGKIGCPQAGRTPEWTMAIPHPIGDKENYLHFVNCGSLKGEFSFLLPPGKYDLEVYSDGPDAKMPVPKVAA